MRWASVMHLPAKSPEHGWDGTVGRGAEAGDAGIRAVAVLLSCADVDEVDAVGTIAAACTRRVDSELMSATA
jgi:hypothetical protein